MGPDRPVEEVVALANRLGDSVDVYFKWTCRACGQRCMFDEPDMVYQFAVHTDCEVEPNAETDVTETGIGMMVKIKLGGRRGPR